MTDENAPGASKENAEPTGGAQSSAQRSGPDQAAVAARVAGAVGAEHAVPDLDRLALDVRGVGDVLLGTGVLDLSHRSRPFICAVGFAVSAAASASRAAFTRLTPSGEEPICSCSLRIASMSISGRGGQPGR